MTNLRLDGEEHEAFPSMLDDEPASARYVEDEDVVTRQFETSLAEHKWIVQVTQLDRRMLSTQQLLAELQTGTLVTAETLVWRGGMEDWLPVIDVEGLPIAGLPIEREWLERRSREQQLMARRRHSLAPSRLLATLPPRAIVRRLQGAVSLPPAPLSPSPLLGLLASSVFALASVILTLYALSRGGVFDAGDEQAARAGHIRRAQAALSVAGKAEPAAAPSAQRDREEPLSIEAQAGN